MKNTGIIFFMLTLFAITYPVRAQTPLCDSLNEGEKTLAKKMMDSIHPYDYCDGTVNECLKEKPPSSLAVRLADDICRLIKAGKNEQEINAAISKRAQTMMPSPKKATFNLDQSTACGDENAPVLLVAYGCARCPFCSKIIPPLYNEVTNGALKGKVRLYFQSFPIKEHQGSTEAGLALISASNQGKFWDYLLRLYNGFDQFAVQKLPDLADELKLNKEEFEKTTNDPATRELLVAKKQEGIRNGVSATPTFFINGRKYLYEVSIPALVDLLSEEYERIAKPADKKTEK